jgi:hypothetical protein
VDAAETGPPEGFGPTLADGVDDLAPVLSSLVRPYLPRTDGWVRSASLVSEGSQTCAITRLSIWARLIVRNRPKTSTNAPLGCEDRYQVPNAEAGDEGLKRPP